MEIPIGFEPTILGLQPRALPSWLRYHFSFGRGAGIYHQSLQPPLGTPFWLSGICALTGPPGTGGGTRTHTPSLAADFESALSAIPTHQHIKLRNAFFGCQLKVDSMCKVAVSVPMVGMMGVEPTRRWRRNLNPVRLPIPPHPHME